MSDPKKEPCADFSNDPRSNSVWCRNCGLAKSQHKESSATPNEPAREGLSSGHGKVLGSNINNNSAASTLAKSEEAPNVECPSFVLNVKSKTPEHCDLRSRSLEQHKPQRMDPCQRTATSTSPHPRDAAKVAQPLTVKDIAAAISSINSSPPPHWAKPKRAVFFGKTEAGKSTTANLLCGVAIVADDSSGTRRYVPAPGSHPVFEIGAMNSEVIGSCTKTLKTVLHPSKCFTLDDLPGDQDTEWKDCIVNNLVKHRALHPPHLQSGAAPLVVPLITLGFRKVITLENGAGLLRALEEFSSVVHGSTEDDSEALYRNNIIILITHPEDAHKSEGDTKAATRRIVNSLVAKASKSSTTPPHALKLLYFMASLLNQRDPDPSDNDEGADPSLQNTEALFVVRPDQGETLADRIVRAIHARKGIPPTYFHPAASREVCDGITTMDAMRGKYLQEHIGEMASSGQLREEVECVSTVCNQLCISTPYGVVNAVMSYRNSCLTAVRDKLLALFQAPGVANEAIARSVAGTLETMKSFDCLKFVILSDPVPCRHCQDQPHNDTRRRAMQELTEQWARSESHVAVALLSDRVKIEQQTVLKSLNENNEFFFSEQLIRSLLLLEFPQCTEAAACMNAVKSEVECAVERRLKSIVESAAMVCDPNLSAAQRKQSGESIGALIRAAKELGESRQPLVRAALGKAGVALQQRLEDLAKIPAEVEHFVTQESNESCSEESFARQCGEWWEWTHALDHVTRQLIPSSSSSEHSRFRIEFDDFLQKLSSTPAPKTKIDRYRVYRYFLVLKTFEKGSWNDASQKRVWSDLAATFENLFQIDFEAIEGKWNAANQNIGLPSESEKSGLAAARKFVAELKVCTNTSFVFTKFPSLCLRLLHLVEETKDVIEALVSPSELFELRSMARWLPHALVITQIADISTKWKVWSDELEKIHLNPIRETLQGYGRDVKVKITVSIERARNNYRELSAQTRWNAVKTTLDQFSTLKQTLPAVAEESSRAVEEIEAAVLKQWKEAQEEYAKSLMDQVDIVTACSKISQSLEMRKRFADTFESFENPPASVQSLKGKIGELTQRDPGTAARLHSRLCITAFEKDSPDEQMRSFLETLTTIGQTVSSAKLEKAKIFVEQGDLCQALDTIRDCPSAEDKLQIHYQCARILRETNRDVEETLMGVKFVDNKVIQQLPDLLSPQKPYAGYLHATNTLSLEEGARLQENVVQLEAKFETLGNQLVKYIEVLNFGGFAVEFSQVFPNYSPNGALDTRRQKVLLKINRALGNVCEQLSRADEKELEEFARRLSSSHAYTTMLPPAFDGLLQQFYSSYRVHCSNLHLLGLRALEQGEELIAAIGIVERLQKLSSIAPTKIKAEVEQLCNELTSKCDEMQKETSKEIDLHLKNEDFAAMSANLAGLAKARRLKAVYVVKVPLSNKVRALISALQAGLTNMVTLGSTSDDAARREFLSVSSRCSAFVQSIKSTTGLLTLLPEAEKCADEVQQAMTEAEKHIKVVAAEAMAGNFVSIEDCDSCRVWARRLEVFSKMAPSAASKEVTDSILNFLSATTTCARDQIGLLKVCSSSMRTGVILGLMSNLAYIRPVLEKIFAQHHLDVKPITDLVGFQKAITSTIQTLCHEADMVLLTDPVSWIEFSQHHEILDSLGTDEGKRLTQSLMNYCLKLENEAMVALKAANKEGARRSLRILSECSSQYRHATLNPFATASMNKIAEHVTTIICKPIDAQVPDDKAFVQLIKDRYQPYACCVNLIRTVDEAFRNFTLTAFDHRSQGLVQKGLIPSGEDEKYAYYNDIEPFFRAVGLAAFVELFRDVIFVIPTRPKMIQKEPTEVVDHLVNGNIKKHRLLQMLTNIRDQSMKHQEACLASDETQVLRQLVQDVSSDKFKTEILAQPVAEEFVSKLSTIFWVSSQMKVPKARKAPHLVQVAAILRLLGWDLPQTATFNHMIQIPTGEGKSLVVGLCAATQALRGHVVHCVCYSEYLCRRDEQDLTNFFVVLGVQKSIHYQTFAQLCEAFVGDIRAASIQILRSGTAAVRAEGEQFPKHKRMLIVDEVDVLFTKRALGATYNAAAVLKDPLITEFINTVWKNRGKTPQELLALEIVGTIKSKFPLATPIIDWGLKQLVNNCNKLESRLPRTVKADDPSRLVYQDELGNPNPLITFPNQTVFHYLHEIETGKITQGYVESLRGIVYFVGRFSYLSIVKQYFGTIVGVTGTLRCLHEIQLKVLEIEFDVKKFSEIGSVFDKDPNIFHFTSQYVHLRADREAWNRGLTTRILDAGDQPLLVYFKNDKAMNEFYAAFGRIIRSNGGTLPPVTLVHRHYPEDLVKAAVACAGDPKAKHFLTKLHGRGLDIVPDAECKQGLLVIQTYYSTTASDQVQIQGRCGRLGKKGRYEMMLFTPEVNEKVGTTIPESVPVDEHLRTQLERGRNEATVVKQIKMKEAVDVAQNKHDLAWRLVEGPERLSGDASVNVKIRLLESQCFSALSPKRLTIMVLDASGSMCGNRWTKLSAAVADYCRLSAASRSETEQKERFFVTAIACEGTIKYVPGLKKQCLAEAKSVDLTPVIRQLFTEGCGTDFEKGFAECATHIQQEASLDPDLQFCILWLTDGQEKDGAKSIEKICALYQDRIVHYKQFIYDKPATSNYPTTKLHWDAFCKGLGAEKCQELLVSSQPNAPQGNLTITDAFRQAATDEVVYLRLDE